MGITSNCAKFLLYARGLGVSYASTITLGRQQLMINESEAIQLAARSPIDAARIRNSEYAEPLFEMLGASHIDSMDHSGFEKATVIHDLNSSLPNHLQSKYSAVFDGGTLEHVFNFPQAVKSCMDMLCVGGHFVSITPANNYCGHGFYQFSPELFFSVFSEEFGFRIKTVIVFVETPELREVNWYKIKDPREVKHRVVLTNGNPTTLMVVAEKIKDTKDIKLTPFQSDYAHIWAVYDSINEDKKIGNESRWIHYYRRFTPEFIKKFIRNVVNRKLKKAQKIDGLGLVNPHFFTKIEF
jgi:hypothetical protein